MDRVELIRRSLRAHVLAWVGLVPLLGLPYSAWAMAEAFRCRAAGRTQWNPAGRYVTAAWVVVGLAMVLQLGLVAMVAMAIAAGGDGAFD